MREIVIATIKFGSGQVVALLCAAITVKIMAVVIGPAGVGLFSLIRQAQQTLASLATCGGQNAVVQGVASRHGDERDRFMISVLWAFVGGSVLLGACAIGFAAPLSDLMFRSNDSGAPTLVRWIAFPVAAGALLVYFRSVLNAHMEIGAVAWTNVITAAGSVLLVYPAVMAYRAGHQVALVLLLGGSLMIGLFFAVYLASLRGCLDAFSRTPPGTFDRSALRHFLWVGLPSLIALFVGMASMLVVRALVARWHGLPAAGQFEAAWSISTLYLTVFLSSMHSYLLPTLSANRSDQSGQEVVERALRLAIIVSVPLISALVLLKPLAIRLLYSGEFLPALELLRWTLLGDYLRVAAWVLATTLVARADMRAYLACELVWSTVFLAGAFPLVQHGMSGAGPAYVAAYALYLAVLLFRTRRRMQIAFHSQILVLWVAGACAVALASYATWGDTHVIWIKAGVLIPATLMSWLAISPTERVMLRTRLAQLLSRLRRRPAVR